VNENLDVFPEPMDSIWFWSLLGLGIAVLEMQKPRPLNGGIEADQN
jgi:hypothetical protein